VPDKADIYSLTDANELHAEGNDVATLLLCVLSDRIFWRVEARELGL